MLVKKELLSVPTLPAPKGKCQDKYIPAAQIVELPKSGRILAVDYYDKKELHARFFCDGKNYAVYSPKKATWGSGYSASGSSGYYVHNVARVAEADSVCNSFFDGRRGVDEVNSFIYQRNSQKRQTTFDNMIFLMKQHMKMFPDYPENLRSYCEDQVFQHGYIFFGKKEKKTGRKAVCSHCGAEFTINTSVLSGKETTCPVCRWKSVYRANWIKSDVTDKEDICISYKVNNQLLLRWAHVERTYCWPEFKGSMHFEDYAYSLYLVVNGKPKIYTYKYFKAPYAWEAEWHRLPLDCTCDSRSYIYTDNLDDVFGSNYYNVHLKAGLEGKHLKLQFVHLLDGLKNDPKAEYLFKLGLPILAASSRYIRGNPDGQGAFQKQIGISKQYLPMLRDMNVTSSELGVIRDSKEWVTPELLQRYRYFDSKINYGITSFLSEAGFTRGLNYLEKQHSLHPKASLNKMVIEYNDYIKMSKALHVDLSHKSVMFPADIFEAHKTITARYNAVMHEIEMIKGKELDQKFNKRVSEHYSRLGLTGFQRDGFRIVLPQKRTDLIAEGQSLNHCVGGESYYKKCMIGVNMIFFVRKEDNPGKPYFTMEMDVTTGKIIQLYGFGDCSAPKEVRAFANAFSQLMRNKKARKTA